MRFRLDVNTGKFKRTNKSKKRNPENVLRQQRSNNSEQVFPLRDRDNIQKK